MAARVNTRFVIALSVVLGLVFISVAGVAFYLVTRSGGELERMGDEAMASQEYERAVKLFGKAYNHDRSRYDRLEKFIKAIESWTPGTEKEYIDTFDRTLIASKAELADLVRTDVRRHRDALDILLELHQRSGSRAESAEALLARVEPAILGFEAAGTSSTEWHALKRYRGLAMVDLLQANRRDLTPEEMARTEADLAAALVTDPSDVETAATQARWFTLLSFRARAQGDQTRAEELRAKALASMDAFIAANPKNARAHLTRLQLRMDMAQESIDPAQSAARVIELRRAAAAGFAEEFAAVADLASAEAPQTLPVTVLTGMALAERMITNGKVDRSRAVIDSVISARPTDSDVLMLRARLAMLTRDYEAAIADFDRVVAIAVPPTSMRGRLLWDHKSEAVLSQAQCAISLWDMADPNNAEAKAAALKRAEEFQAKLAGWQGLLDLSQQRALLDAKVAFARDDMVKAQRLLIEFNRLTERSNTDGLRLQAQVEIRSGRPGEARALFARLCEIDAGNPVSWILHGDACMAVQEYDAAMGSYTTALELDPTNEYALNQVGAIKALRGEVVASDPVAQVLLEASRMASDTSQREGDVDGAIKLLEGSMEATGHDARIYEGLVSLYQRKGDRAAAVNAAERGAAKQSDPESLAAKRLNILKQVAAQGDTLETRLLLIDTGTGPLAHKHVSRYRAYKDAGKPEDAARELELSIKADPDDPYVVEAIFVDALDRKDLTKAREMEQRAISGNLDRVDGLTYTARVQMAQNQRPDAAATLKRATDLGTASAQTWRLLGMLLMELGSSREGLDAFQQSLKLRPDDVETIKSNLRALITQNQLESALTAARAGARYASADDDFNDMHLALEQEVGDKQLARVRREAVLRRDPANVKNKQSLAQLYIQMREWAKARQLLDELRKTSSDMALIRLDAAWHAEQNRFDEASAVFQSEIDARVARGEKPSPDLYLAMGALLVARRQVDQGLEAMAKGRPFQDPATMEVDRIIGFTLFEVMRYEQALEPLRAFIATGKDEKHEARSRLAESLVFLGRFKEAEEAIVQLGEAADRSLPLVLIRAEAARGLQDRAKRRMILDKAVASFPQEPIVYVKRAEALREEAELLRDALADLNTALRLNQRYWQALQVRALVYNDLGDTNRALDDLMAAVEINPRLDGARDLLLEGLMQLGRTSDVVKVVNKAAEAANNDAVELSALGDFLFDRQLYREAAPLYARAWNQAKSPDVAARHAITLLRQVPNDLPQAEIVLAAPNLDIDKNPALLMTRAMLRQRQGRIAQARQDATLACQLSMDTPEKLEAMLNRLIEVFADDAGAVIDFVRTLDMARMPDQWGPYFKARFQLYETAAAPSAATQLLAIRDQAQDKGLRVLIARVVGAYFVVNDRWDDAVAVIKKGLEDDAGNVELNNNLAYVLAAEQGKAQEALAYAEAAAKSDPKSAMVLDTLGFIYLELGRPEDASKVLTEALANPAPAEAHLSAAIHVASAFARLNNRTEAQRHYDGASGILTRFPQFSKIYGPKLDAVRKEIDRLP